MASIIYASTVNAENRSESSLYTKQKKTTPQWLQSEPTSTKIDFSFPAMGTLWHITGNGRPRSLNQAHLHRYCLETVAQYDRTFSDWSEFSELRQLEHSNLTIAHGASVLFIRGLRLAEKAYYQTNKGFDITVGDKIWSKQGRTIGLDQLVWSDDGKKFHFKKNPRRLTFGGIAKGMTVGHLAQILYATGIDEFRIDAGGGNIAEYPAKKQKRKDQKPLPTTKIAQNETKPCPESMKYIQFLSHSNPKQKDHNNHQHIKNPGAGSEPTKSVSIRCHSPQEENDDWQAIGALSDAYSTAYTIKKFPLPKHCEIL